MKKAAGKILLRGFGPVVGDEPRVLILGSMPGVESLRQQQYYGHPRNHFWMLMDELLSVPRDAPYEDRLECLRRRHVALWDVVGACRRRGSLDQRIEPDSVRINGVARLLAKRTSIRAVFLNGTKAAELFRRHVAPSVKRPLHVERLPSTSPAHASRTCAEKLERWKVILDWVGQPADHADNTDGMWRCRRLMWTSR